MNALYVTSTENKQADKISSGFFRFWQEYEDFALTYRKKIFMFKTFQYFPLFSSQSMTMAKHSFNNKAF